MPSNKSRLARAGYSYQHCAFIDIARAICSDFGLTLDELGEKPAVFVDAVGERVVIKVERAKRLFDHRGTIVESPDDTKSRVAEVLYHADSDRVVLWFDSSEVIVRL